MSKIQQALEQFRSKTNITHTTTGAFEGSYSIPEGYYDSLYKTLLKSLGKHKNIGIIERPPANKIKQFMIDLDLHYEKETDIDYEIIGDFCLLIINCIFKYTNYFENNNKLQFYIQSRNTGYFSKGIFKNGVHIIIPNFICNIDIQYLIRKIILEENNLQELFRTINNSNDIFDESVIEKNGFYLYGTGKPELGPYKNDVIFEYDYKISELNSLEDDFTNEIIDINIIKLLSQRKHYNTENISQINDKYKDLLEKQEKPKESEKPKIILKRNNKTNNSIKELSDAESVEFIYILNNISETRFDDFQDWLKIAIILKQSGINFFYFDLFSKKSNKYNKDECLTFWENLDLNENKEKLTIGTLFKWFKEDNLLEYNDYINTFNRTLKLCTQNQISIFYYHLIKQNNQMKKYYYNEENNEWFYMKQNKTWSITKRDPLSLRNDIINTYRNIIDKKIEYYNIKKCKIEKEFNTLKISEQQKKLDNELVNLNDKSILESKINDIKENIKNLIKLTKMIENINDDKAIMDYFKSEFRNEEISINSFNKPNLFSAKNLVFDMNIENNKIIGWRNIMPQDLIMKTTNFNYITKPLIEEQNKIKSIIYSIFENNDMVDFILRLFSRYLNGSRAGAQYFYLFTGIGANGKSLLFNFLMDCFGDYATTIEDTTLTHVQTRANEHNDDLAKLPGCRLALVKEFQEGATVNCKIIKEITGDDVIRAREIHKKQINFKPQSHLGVICNTKPKFNESTDAMNRRNIVIDFPFRFCIKEGDDPNDEKFTDKDRKMNNQLSELLKQEKYQIALLQLLTDIYINNYSNILDITNIPSNVLENTHKYNLENDIIKNWFNEFYEREKTAEPINAAELKNQFIIDTSFQIKPDEFYKLMKSKLNIDKTRCLKNGGYGFKGLKRKLEEKGDNLELMLGECPLKD